MRDLVFVFYATQNNNGVGPNVNSVTHNLHIFKCAATSYCHLASSKLQSANDNCLQRSPSWFGEQQPFRGLEYEWRFITNLGVIAEHKVGLHRPGWQIYAGTEGFAGFPALSCRTYILLNASVLIFQSIQLIDVGPNVIYGLDSGATLIDWSKFNPTKSLRMK